MRSKVAVVLFSLATLLLVACGDIVEYSENTGIAEQEEYTIMQLFQSVLQNERQFYSNFWGFIYLNELPYDYPRPTSIAVFDMNDDGNSEVIVNFNYTLKYVLHYYDGEIFGTEFVIRSMNAIMADGRFFLSPSGMGNFGIGELAINGGTADIVTIYSFDSIWDGQYNVLNGVSISDEELEIWHASVTAAELINWHPFSEESFQNLASLITPRSMPLDKQSEVITIRIHPDMPEFTVTRIVGNAIADDSYLFPEPVDVRIIIADENEVVIQEINNLTQSRRSSSGGLSFADYNFDGYLDMRLMRWQDSAGGLLAQEYFWLWDVSTMQFVLHEQLMEIGHSAWLGADEERQRI